MVARFDGKRIDVPLTGSTAVLLKLQECWHETSGWDPKVANKLGTIAFQCGAGDTDECGE